ncbi:MAG: class I SAM-dependent methyltransferase [Candidatus Nanopelagicaceae bacterium]|nr:class I SAM-dependent methyltransferase [Candidatus Nanopelagicaceae bacterium]
MNRFLKIQQQITDSTKFLQSGGFLKNEVCEPKNWDLSLILPCLCDGNVLDMGCQGSIILNNCVKMGLVGEKVGIDLVPVPAFPGIQYFVGDITKSKLPSENFDFITCLSVIEHGVKAQELLQECARLLRRNGRLFLTFDYWDPKLDTTGVYMFGLPYRILSRLEVEEIVRLGADLGLCLQNPIDWTTQDKILKPGYWSPCNHSYTFGAIELVKERLS